MRENRDHKGSIDYVYLGLSEFFVLSMMYDKLFSDMFPNNFFFISSPCRPSESGTCLRGSP